MERTRFADMHCSVARTAAILRDPWTLLVMRDLFLGLTRFSDLKCDLGLATNVLAQRLDHLVTEGIVRRERYHNHPPRDEYRLTPDGTDLYAVVLSMMAWGDRHRGDDGVPLQVRHTTCGAVIAPVVSCPECHSRLTPDVVEHLPGPGGRRAPGTNVVGRVLDGRQH